MTDPLAGLYCSDFLTGLVGIYEDEDGGWCPGFDFCAEGSPYDAYFRECPAVYIPADLITVGNEQEEESGLSLEEQAQLEAEQAAKEAFLTLIRTHFEDE